MQGFDDLLACSRLTRHVASGPFLVSFIVAANIERNTYDSVIQLLAHSTSDRKYMSDLKRQWQALSPLPPLANYFDVGERISYLDATCYIAREGWHVMQDFIGLITNLSSDGPQLPEEKEPWNGALTAIVTRLVRWDEPLKLGNAWYDRLVRIAKMKNPKEQQKMLERYRQDLDSVQHQATIVPTRAGLLFNSRKIATDRTSKILVGMMLPALEAAIIADDRLKTHSSMFNLALALAQFRAEHNGYPSTLKKLVPEYIPRIPADDFSGSEFVYRKTDGGYLLYSLGKNGRDDGGKNADGQNESDDVIIEITSKEK